MSLYGLSLFFLGVFAPGWDDVVEAGIGDRLSKMLGCVADDEEQNAALRILSAEPVEALIQVGVGHAWDRPLGVGEGIFGCGHDLGFVGSGLLETLQVNASRRRRPHEFVQVVVRRAN